MRVYEEYETPAEKKQAQRGAKRGKPTGKARGYFFAFTENGIYWSGGRAMQEGVGSVFYCEPGDGPDEAGRATTSASCDWLRENCRYVGAKHLPAAWRKVYAWYAAK